MNKWFSLTLALLPVWMAGPAQAASLNFEFSGAYYVFTDAIGQEGSEQYVFDTKFPTQGIGQEGDDTGVVELFNGGCSGLSLCNRDWDMVYSATETLFAAFDFRMDGSGLPGAHLLITEAGINFKADSMSTTLNGRDADLLALEWTPIVPLPSAALLLIAGLGVLVGVARNRSA